MLCLVDSSRKFFFFWRGVAELCEWGTVVGRNERKGGKFRLECELILYIEVRGRKKIKIC